MTRIGSAVLGSWLCLGLASAIALSAPAPAAGAETPPGPTDPTGVEAPGSPDGGARGSRSTVRLPRTDLFEPLLADPKEPRTFAAWVFSSPTTRRSATRTSASPGLGATGG